MGWWWWWVIIPYKGEKKDKRYSQIIYCMKRMLRDSDHDVKETLAMHVVIRNNTEQAENQDVVFFNRVPKTGSQMVQELSKILAIRNNFTAYIVPAPLLLFPSKTEEERFSGNCRRRLSKPGVYFRHVPRLEVELHMWRCIRLPVSTTVRSSLKKYLSSISRLGFS